MTTFVCFCLLGRCNEYCFEMCVSGAPIQHLVSLSSYSGLCCGPPFLTSKALRSPGHAYFDRSAESCASLRFGHYVDAGGQQFSSLPELLDVRLNQVFDLFRIDFARPIVANLQGRQKVRVIVYLFIGNQEDRHMQHANFY